MVKFNFFNRFLESIQMVDILSVVLKQSINNCISLIRGTSDKQNKKSNIHRYFDDHFFFFCVYYQLDF